MQAQRGPSRAMKRSLGSISSLSCASASQPACWLLQDIIERICSIVCHYLYPAETTQILPRRLLILSRDFPRCPLFRHPRFRHHFSALCQESQQPNQFGRPLYLPPQFVRLKCLEERNLRTCLLSHLFDSTYPQLRRLATLHFVLLQFLELKGSTGKRILVSTSSIDSMGLVLTSPARFLVPGLLWIPLHQMVNPRRVAQTLSLIGLAHPATLSVVGGHYVLRSFCEGFPGS
mmetsp:Transcript_3249/g.6685  ORF Transcript_3249/g.6685 Transcript_3249/m.6685 type:complete len:232 (-) Transcript_3249:486-1181(-)